MMWTHCSHDKVEAGTRGTPQWCPLLSRGPIGALVVQGLLATGALAQPDPSSSSGAVEVVGVVQGSTAPVETYQFNRVFRTITVRNGSNESVEITGHAPAFGHGDFPVLIEPHTEGQVRLSFDTADRLGRHLQPYDVFTSSADTPVLRYTWPLFIQSAYSPELPIVDFGGVSRLAGGVAFADVTTYLSEDYSFLARQNLPPALSLVDDAPTSGLPQKRRLTFELNRSAPLGQIQETIYVRTDLAVQPVLPVMVRARVYESVVPVPQVLSFGAVSVGQPVVQRLELLGVEGTRPEVLEVESAEGISIAGTYDCGSSCSGLAIALDTGRARAYTGELRISMVGDSELLAVPFHALVVKEGVKVRDLGTLGRDSSVEIEPVEAIND